MKTKPKFLSCGCCGQYHSVDFWGDCREDKSRFNIEDLDALHPGGWEEVEMPEVTYLLPL